MEHLELVELKQDELREIEGGKWEWGNFFVGLVAAFVVTFALLSTTDDVYL